MLKCRDVAHEASDYVDQNMSKWHRFWFNLHLMICANCRVFVRHVRATRDFIALRGRPAASDAEVQTVMQTIRKSDSQP